MNFKPMTILIIEDDVNACNKFRECAKRRNDIQIVKITDSDIDGLEYAKEKRPEGIILDLELNNSSNGNVSSMGIVSKLRKISPNYEPVIIVTTHVKSKRTYEILHRDNVDLIMYKEQANYSSENVFNTLLTYRKEEIEELPETYELEKQDLENKISKSIDRELDLIGITEKMKGRRYIHDAIMFLVQNEDSDTNVIRYLTKKHQRTEMYRKLLMVSQQKSLLHISNLFWLTSCNYNSSKLRKLSYTCYGDLIISLPRLEAIFLKFLYYF